jgi:hypothetical protein
MRHFSSRVGAILMSALCSSGTLASDCTDCTVASAIATVFREDDRPRWLLSMTFDDPDSRFGVAVGFAQIATPFERALIAAGVDVESSWTIGLRFEIGAR